MMTAQRRFPDEEIIKARAYAIWEGEGRPHGRDLDHWRRASQEVAAMAAEAPRRKEDTARPAARRVARTITPDAARGADAGSTGARAPRSRTDGH
ncbi:MAG: DUF2934 domain-containing protein [Roseiarcus sp.]|jgi:hypothetical protein